MRLNKEFLKRFLTETDKSGRFIVKSRETGKTYFVEPIYKGEPSLWGDLDPASKKMTGDYGTKYPGAVTEKDSLITKENGFNRIRYIHGGSPFGVIDQLDREYLQQMKN